MGWVSFEKAERRLQSQVVLDDATNAAVKWMYGPIEKGAESRYTYAAAVTLLRSVGHVLHKVDCKRHPEISDEVKRRYKRWKTGEQDDLIFSEFIERERNLILKEYSPQWTPKNEVALNFQIVVSPSKRSEEPTQLQEALNAELAEKPLRAIVMPDGPFAGWAFDELLHEAGRWWNRELSEIEYFLKEPK